MRVTLLLMLFLLLQSLAGISQSEGSTEQQQSAVKTEEIQLIDLLDQLAVLHSESEQARKLARQAESLAEKQYAQAPNAYYHQARYWDIYTHLPISLGCQENLPSLVLEMERACLFFVEKERDKYWLNKCRLQLANLNYALFNDPVTDSLTQIVLEDITIFEKVNRFARLYGEAYRNLGNKFFEAQKDSSEWYYQKAIQAYERDSSALNRMAITYMNLAKLETSRENWEAARDNYELASEYIPSTDTVLRVERLIEMAHSLNKEAWAKQDDYETILHEMRAKLIEAEELEEPSLQAKINLYYGACYQHMAVLGDTINNAYLQQAGKYYGMALKAEVEGCNDYAGMAFRNALKLLNKDFQNVNSSDYANFYEVLRAIPTVYEENDRKLRAEIIRVEAESAQLEREKASQKFREAISWSLLLLGGLGIAYLIQQLRQLRKTFSLRMQMLRAQMNNHFVFNTLNAIDGLIWKEQKMEASEYLVKFSNLCRGILNSSRSTMISFGEEIRILGGYLDCEQLRLRDKLIIDFPDRQRFSKANFLVPPLVLQPFAENAIWHGILKKAEHETGTLTIRVDEEEDRVICTIQDDGIGREKARQLKKESTHQFPSLGMAITEEKIALVRQLRAASLEVIDLYDANGQATGTQVVVILPKIRKHAD